MALSKDPVVDLFNLDGAVCRKLGRSIPGIDTYPLPVFRMSESGIRQREVRVALRKTVSTAGVRTDVRELPFLDRQSLAEALIETAKQLIGYQSEFERLRRTCCYVLLAFHEHLDRKSSRLCNTLPTFERTGCVFVEEAEQKKRI